MTVEITTPIANLTHVFGRNVSNGGQQAVADFVDDLLATSGVPAAIATAIDASTTAEDTLASALTGNATTAAALGAGITAVASGTGASARTLQARFREVVSVDDFEAVGDGVADDAAAWNAALTAAAGGRLVARQGATYRVDSVLTLPNASIEIDLRGATIVSNGNHRTFASAHNNTAAVTTISSGATLRSRSVVVASASGLAVGQLVQISADNAPTEDALSYPAVFVRIDSIVGTTIALQEALPITYAGTVYLTAYSSMPEILTIKNGTIDGSPNTYNAGIGQGVYASQYINVVLDRLTFKAFDNDDTNTNACVIFSCKSARLSRCIFDGYISKTNVAEFQNVETAVATENSFDGDGFGLEFLRAMHATAERNTLIGRHSKNIADGISPLRSIRGIKTYGCGHVLITGNTVRDFSTPIKLESGATFDISHNHVSATNPDGSGGGVGINISSQTAATSRQGHGSITKNTIMGLYVGVSIQDPVGNNEISGNTIHTTNLYAIDVSCPDTTIVNNRIVNWSLDSSAGTAVNSVHATGRDLIDGNTFSHSSNTQRCLAVTSPNARIGVNRALTANKMTLLYTAAAVSEEVAAEVCRGTTYLGNQTGDYTAIAVKFDEEQRNIGGCYNSGNGRFTALLPGIYAFKGGLQAAGFTAAHQYCLMSVTRRDSGGTILVRKTIHYTEVKYLFSIDNQISFAWDTTFAMAAGDTLEIEFKVTDGVASGANKVVGLQGRSSTQHTTWAMFNRVSPT